MPTTFTVDGGSTCLVRMATAEDAPAVHRLVCELEQQTFDYDTFRERFISQLENPAMHCFILELDGTPAGYLNMRIDRHLHHACPTAEIIEFIRRAARASAPRCSPARATWPSSRAASLSSLHPSSRASTRIASTSARA